MSYLRIRGLPAEDAFGRRLNEARALFRSFHCYGAEHGLLRARCRSAPEVMVRLGKLKAIIYTSDRGQRGRPRTFVHFLETPPALCSNPEGDQLYILGGCYRVTRRGIVG